MLKTDKVVVVEGKYDAIKLANLIDGTILRTDGFGIFKDREKQELLRTLAEKRGLIVLTDSDSAGFLIRNFLKSSIPEEQITHVYIPDVYGKERRKDHPSAEGKLGVEGVPDEILLEAFRRAGITEEGKPRTGRSGREITSFDFYEAGLFGRPGSKELRLRLQKRLGLPERMTAKQLLSIINMLVTYEQLQERLEELRTPDFSMELPRPVQTAILRLEEAGYEAYAVGGCIRDTLLGKTPVDWDLTTSALPEETEAVFSSFSTIATGIQHGTVTVLIDGQSLEITTFRLDGDYSDYRHPSAVTFTRSLREDLARRDFTVNAMAFSPRTGLVDEFGGLADLQHATLRCVGDPHRRFSEDALRVLRGIRFSSTLGFSLEPETERAIRKDASLVSYVSVERQTAELKKLLLGEQVTEVLLAYPEVIRTVVPELGPAIGFEQNNPHHRYTVYEHIARAVGEAPACLTTRLALLFHDVGKPATYAVHEDGFGHFFGHVPKSAELADAALRRLRFSNREREQAVFLIRNHEYPLTTEPKRIRRLIGKFGPDLARQLIDVERADNLAKGTEDPDVLNARFDAVREALEQALHAEDNCFTVRDLKITGRDLIAAGVPEGPAVGETLDRLLQAVQEETIENEREALLAFLQQ